MKKHNYENEIQSIPKANDYLRFHNKRLANLLLRLPDSATFDESVESLENDTAALIFHHEHEEAFEEYKRAELMNYEKNIQPYDKRLRSIKVQSKLRQEFAILVRWSM